MDVIAELKQETIEFYNHILQSRAYFDDSIHKIKFTTIMNATQLRRVMVVKPFLPNLKKNLNSGHQIIILKVKKSF